MFMQGLIKTLTNGHCINLALHNHCGILAAVQIDRVRYISVGDSEVRLVLVVFLQTWC